MNPKQTEEIDLRELDVGDEISIETDGGEQFDLVIADVDGDEATNHARGHVNLTVEGGGVWEQVKDRVDSGVLNLRQHFERLTAEPRTARVFGTVWEADDGVPKEAAEPYYEPLGEIVALDVAGDA